MVFRKVGNKTTAIIICGFFVVALITALWMYLAGISLDKTTIHESIHSQGGTVMDIENVSLDSTPFPVYSETGRRKQESGNQFYKVSYSKNGIVHAAWYRGVNGPFGKPQTHTRSGDPIEETPENEGLIYRYGARWIFTD
ncbi:hypothetical protein P4V64_18230 [Bacillus thuringiensis]|nr:hypothetical protein [Bacillus thuringiensis]